MDDARGEIVEFPVYVAKFDKTAGKPGKLVLEIGKDYSAAALEIVGKYGDLTFEGAQLVVTTEGPGDGQSSFDGDVSDDERTRRVEATAAGADADTGEVVEDGAIDSADFNADDPDGEEIPFLPAENDDDDLPDDLAGGAEDAAFEDAVAEALPMHDEPLSATEITLLLRHVEERGGDYTYVMPGGGETFRLHKIGEVLELTITGEDQVAADRDAARIGTQVGARFVAESSAPGSQVFCYQTVEEDILTAE